MSLRIHWSDGSVEDETFTHLYSGYTRDAFDASVHPWVLKIEVPVVIPKPRNHSKDEWLIYSKFESLNQILPKCYGYAVLERGVNDLHCILMDRVAFTFESFFNKIRFLEMTDSRLSIIQHMILRTVIKMVLVSGDGLYHTTDWHTGNIAFNYVEHSEEDVDMKLIDFSGHEKKLFETPRYRMQSGMKALLCSLPGPHCWGTDDMSVLFKDEHVNACKWKSFMQYCTASLAEWWDSVEFPTTENMKSLEFLMSIQGNSFRNQASSSNDTPVPTNQSNYLCSASIASYLEYHCDTPSAPNSLASQANADAEVLEGFPVLTLRALMNAARKQRAHSLSAFRQGSIKRIGVPLTLEQRLQASPPNLPHHGQDSKPHSYSSQEGNELSVVFGIFLEELRDTKIVERVQPGKDGKIPAQCYDAIKFNKTYAVPFQKLCMQPSKELSASAQRETLRRFLFQKFSVDPEGLHMTPPPGKRLKTLSWQGFYMTDTELSTIVDRVVTVYLRS